MPGLVLHLRFAKTREVIYASNGKAYVRRGAQSLPIEGDEVLQRLKYDKGISSFEDELVDAELNSITNSAVIIDFLLRVVPTAEPEVWLEKQRLIAKKRPTVAGTLLFSEEPQAILPKRSAIKGEALECLRELGWIRPEAALARDGGRPTVRFHINPRVTSR
jgi:ATP-dependent DNA helicase RecG